MVVWFTKIGHFLAQGSFHKEDLVTAVLLHKVSGAYEPTLSQELSATLSQELFCYPVPGVGLLPCPRSWPATLSQELVCYPVPGVGLLPCPRSWSATLSQEMVCYPVPGVGLLPCARS
jgi:hypothetical protein